MNREKGPKGNWQNVQRPNEEVKEEEHEVSVVVVAHTVAHPRTEVIHVEDALPRHAEVQINQRSEMVLQVLSEIACSSLPSY